MSVHCQVYDSKTEIGYDLKKLMTSRKDQLYAPLSLSEMYFVLFRAHVYNRRDPRNVNILTGCSIPNEK